MASTEPTGGHRRGRARRTRADEREQALRRPGGRGANRKTDGRGRRRVRAPRPGGAASGAAEAGADGGGGGGDREDAGILLGGEVALLVGLRASDAAAQSANHGPLSLLVSSANKPEYTAAQSANHGLDNGHAWARSSLLAGLGQCMTPWLMYDSLVVGLVGPNCCMI